MFWEEKESDKSTLRKDVIDVLFSLDCRELPVEHIAPLSQALIEAAPWLSDEPQAAIHPVHLAGSQNGWERPAADAEQQLMLSKRTKLTLRIPRHRLDDAKQLCGQTILIDGYPMKLGKVKTKELSRLTTIFCRDLTTTEEEDEMTFLSRIASKLEQKGIQLSKALPGKLHTIQTNNGELHTRSLLLANLTPEQSLLLQHDGIGDQQLLGCGIFIPHKGIDAVHEMNDD